MQKGAKNSKLYAQGAELLLADLLCAGFCILAIYNKISYEIVKYNIFLLMLWPSDCLKIFSLRLQFRKLLDHKHDQLPTWNPLQNLPQFWIPKLEN